MQLHSKPYIRSDLRKRRISCKECPPMQLHQLVSRIHKVSAGPVNFMELTFVFLNLPEDEKEYFVKRPLSVRQ